MHDHAAEASLFKRRALFTFICVVALLSVLVTNLYHLQVESYKDYETRSNDNRIRVVPIAPSRGLILQKRRVTRREPTLLFSRLSAGENCQYVRDLGRIRQVNRNHSR